MRVLLFFFLKKSHSAWVGTFCGHCPAGKTRRQRGQSHSGRLQSTDESKPSASHGSSGMYLLYQQEDCLCSSGTSKAPILMYCHLLSTFTCCLRFCCWSFARFCAVAWSTVSTFGTVVVVAMKAFCRSSTLSELASLWLFWWIYLTVDCLFRVVDTT